MRRSLAIALTVALAPLTLALPAGAQTHHAAPRVTKVAFAGSYHGKIALLWSNSSVRATAVTGTGSATRLGASTLTGAGSATTSSTCDPLSGRGVIASRTSRLVLSITTSSATQACAAADSAPTTVTVHGVAKVLSGTGLYRGVSGTLKFSGSFSIASTTAGSSESDAFTAKLTGVLSIKK